MLLSLAWPRPASLRICAGAPFSSASSRQPSCAAQHHFEALVFGLALSVIMMGVAASYIARLLHRFRWIAWIGLAIILFVAVRMLLEGAGAFVTIPEIPLLYTPHAAAAAVVH
jgi:predicted tellurium resistance membrane protein TerC